MIAPDPFGTLLDCVTFGIQFVIFVIAPVVALARFERRHP